MEHPLSRSSLPPLLTEPRHFGRRAATVVLFVALAALIWYAAKVLILVFAGALLAVFLDFLAGKLAETARIRRGWAFAIVAVGISVLLGYAAWTALPRVADQVTQLIRGLPQTLQQIQSYLQGREWGRMVSQYIPDMLASSHLTDRVSKIFGDAFYGLLGLGMIGVLGIYLGAHPSFYVRGVLKLFPQERREAARDVLSEVGYTLRWWVIGQLIPMCVLGAATIVGLLLMHVRLAFTLGLFTAFMIFIPYIGSIIALLVTVVATLVQGTTTVLYVILLFLGVHVAEGYLLTPMVQRRAVYLPPALTITSQVLLGLLLGFPGLALATPLTAAGLVLVKMLYLHERPQHHG